MGTLANYGGDSIFGEAVKMTSEVNPTADQINAFFGVNGVESLFGGTRGRVFMVSGVLRGTTAGALDANESIFTSYRDGISRVLVNTRGTPWPQVVLKTFSQDGERDIQDSWTGDWFRPYKALFVSLAS